MVKTTNPNQYKDSRNLQKRGNLHARYANRNWFEWVADQIDFPSGSDVLDVGCGAGWFWLSAASHLPSELRLTLTDTSQGMVKEATQKLLVKRHFTDVTGKTTDAEALPFPDQSFDCAIAMHMIYHVRKPEKVIDEIARVLRPGGLVGITINGDDNMHEIFELGSKAFGGDTCDPTASLFGVVSAQVLITRHFDSVEVHKFEDFYFIDDAEDIYYYLISFPPGIDATESQKNELRNLISVRLSQGNGVLKVKRECALIWGR